MHGLTEYNLVENYIIKRLIDTGWTYIKPEELDREGPEEPLLTNNLLNALRRINPAITDKDAHQAIAELRNTGTGQEGAKKIIQYIRNGIPVKLEKKKIIKNIQLFDQQNTNNNEFIITNQITYRGLERIRCDIILYINGTPLVNIECKNPTDPSTTWEDAYRQIKDYERKAPELYKYTQIGIAAEATAKYFPIVPWQEQVKTYEWKTDEKTSDPLEPTIQMLKPQTLLDIITNYTLFREERQEATKILPRYIQYRATNKIIERIQINQKGEENKTRGLIWHWQGSGKTLTMIYTAYKLQKILKNPTIILIIDRRELEQQHYNEFNSMDITPKPEIIQTRNDLKQIIQHDDYKGKRGIFLILIHKFTPTELQEIQQELEQISKQRETIMKRKDIVILIDEGHRSQYGIYKAQLDAIFKNAYQFAFTGTPISKKDRNTYQEFSYPPLEQYLDKYFLKESIQDNHTLPITYQPRLEEIHLNKQLLEAFWQIEEEEIPEEIKETVEEEIKQRLNTIKMILENQNRIEKIAEDISKHYLENIDGRFKAMIIAGSRLACVRYKKALDKHLPPEYTAVIMTYGSHEKAKEIREYAEQIKRKHYGKEIDQITKDTIEKFKEENQNPRIAIVTDMLLTGFDSPILQTIYLDKPLKEHRLLQAIARTNRPYNNLKETGLIIDYIGILKEINKGLEMYTKEDITPEVIQPIEKIAEEFTQHIQQALAIIGPKPQPEITRQHLMEAFEKITTDPQKKEQFQKTYRKLRKLFELLGPDQIKLRHLEEYKWVSATYTYYLNITRQKDETEPIIEKYFQKTIKYIHKSTEIQKIQQELPSMTFDENYLINIEKQIKDKKEKAANILFTLNRFILVEKKTNPIYETLVERVHRLIEEWRQKTKDYEKIYQEATQIVREIQESNKRQLQLGLTPLEYAILLTIEKTTGDGELAIQRARALAETLKPHLFQGWQNQPTTRKKIEQELRKYARKLIKEQNLNIQHIDTLYNELLRDVINYA
ncbi:MAG: HsdR family type I site-specific deoxyribonuclease [Candidatus Caldarchaeum sp.]